MPRRLLSALVVLTLPLLGSVAAAAPAAPAADTTPPVVRVEPSPRYVVGTRVSDSDIPDRAPWYSWTVSLHWTSSDPSGICAQSVRLSNLYDPGSTSYEVDPAARQFMFVTSTSAGAGSPSTLQVTAQDCAGNASSSAVSTVSSGCCIEDASPDVAYSDTWLTGTFGGFLGGTAHSTTQAGASVRVPVVRGPLGLIMLKAPKRGSVDVYLDGVKKATVSTRAPETQRRQVVWQTRVTGDGPHVLEVVNRATPGRPRVDFDGVAN